MTAAATIAKLEALLARVLVRAGEPRGLRASDGAAEEDVDEATIPPPPLVRAAIGDVEIEMGEVAEVDMSDGPDIVVGEATAADDTLLDEISGSRERLVAAERGDTSRGLEGDEADGDDDEEPAPASSRRPVAPPPEERLAEIAFGADEPPPVRTPPPKSGPLPAPPPERDADVTGVRSSVPAPAVRELEPEVARLRQVADAREPIVDVIGEAQRFAPATFVALLDASLEL